MKTILRSIFINSLVLYLAILMFDGLVFDGTLKTLVIAAVTLTLLNKIVKPIIKLFLLPINVLTLGFFGWVANVVTLFILTRAVRGIGITGFYFPGFDISGFVAPSFNVSVLASFVLTSLIISLTHTLIVWLLRK